MGEVGCYDYTLYCDSPLHPAGHKFAGADYGGWPTQYTGRNLSACRREARKAGWLIRPRADSPEWSASGKHTGLTICPKCVRAERLAARQPDRREP